MICALINSNQVVSVQGLTADQVAVLAPSYQRIKDVTSLTPQPRIGWSYDQSSDTLSGPAAPPASMKITKLAFRNRCTFSELCALQAASATSIPLQVLKDNLLVATFIDLSRPDTIAAIGMIVAMGIVTSDRAHVILTTPPTSAELYVG